MLIRKSDIKYWIKECNNQIDKCKKESTSEIYLKGKLNVLKKLLRKKSPI